MEPYRTTPVFPFRPLAVFSLCLALTVYALAGSPTPDNPGMVEALTGLLLAVSVLAALSSSRRPVVFQERDPYRKSLIVFLGTGLVLPAIAGACFGNDRMLMLRDILAFSFLALPVVFGDIFADGKRDGAVLRSLAVFAGVAFCVRTLVPAFNVWIPQGELLYLSNSPLSLFAAVYLAGRFWTSLEHPSWRNLVIASGCLCGLGIIMAAMMLDVQRATVGAVWVTWGVLAVHTLLFRPRRLFWPVLLTGAACFLFYPLLAGALEAMALKTSQVGLNARLAEAEAVYRALAGHPVALVTGLGWGASFASPAVGGLPVNFTHSLLTTMALKGGLILFALTGAVVLAALYRIFLVFQQDRVGGMALFWAFSIPVFLYASHKSLDFGLVLLMIAMWRNDAGPLHKSHSSVKTGGQP